MFAENQIQVITTIDYRNNNDLKHDLTKEEEMFAEKQIQVITTIVHSIVNHQARIDVGWHDASLEAIKDAKIIPSECTESQLQSALVEIITLTTLAHHYNVAFILMGLKGGWELPSLADVKDAPKLQEPRFDPEKLLKEGQTLQCDDTVIRSPYYTYFQVDKSSGTFTCLPKENQDLLFAYTNIMTPFIGLTLAPQYADLMYQSNKAMYLDLLSFSTHFSFMDIRGDKCAGVTRGDIETVAWSLSKAYSCDF